MNHVVTTVVRSEYKTSPDGNYEYYVEVEHSRWFIHWTHTYISLRSIEPSKWAWGKYSPFKISVVVTNPDLLEVLDNAAAWYIRTHTTSATAYFEES